MEIYKILKVAKEMNADPVFAMNCRRRYLTGRLWEVQEDIREWLSVSWKSLGDVACFVSAMAVLDVDKTVIEKELKVIDKMILERKNEITQEMIEQARRYPIDKLVKFVRGKATAPCHHDRNPSLYHGTRKNIAVCPVCDKKFGPIDWLMEVEGRTFAEAVKELQ